MADARGLLKVAVLDDYQNVALSLADWSSLDGRASITVFNDHVADPDMVVARLAPFQVVCVMRERTPMPRAIIERLPSLRLIASTGPGNASIDVAAATERGVQVVHTGYWLDADDRADLGLDTRRRPSPHERDRCRAKRGLAANHRRRPEGQYSWASWPWQYRQRRGPNRQSLWHERHRLELKLTAEAATAADATLVTKENFSLGNPTSSASILC